MGAVENDIRYEDESKGRRHGGSGSGGRSLGEFEGGGRGEVSLEREGNVGGDVGEGKVGEEREAEDYDWDFGIEEEWGLSAASGGIAVVILEFYRELHLFLSHIDT